MSERNATYHLFGIIRILLYPLALLYGGVVWLRNRLYDAGFFSSVEFSVPVIAVGNLSVGGTGKTPHVEYLLRLLEYRYRTATMSRGYGRRTQGFMLADENSNALRIGDEPMQYHLNFPEVAVSVAEERMTGIPRLLQRRPEVEVVILDDAYQHRSVKPGLNILITDFSKPFYDDHILPYGTLREARKAYHRADVVVVSKCPPSLTRERSEEIRERLAPLPHQQVFFSTIRYGEAHDFFSREPVSLSGQHLVLVAGIAKPAPLLQRLKDAAADVHPLLYRDHHFFGSRDLEEIRAAYAAWDVVEKLVLTTEKDAARLHLFAERLKEWNLPLAVLPIRTEFLFDDGQAFDSGILGYIERERGTEASDSPDAGDIENQPID